MVPIQRTDHRVRLPLFPRTRRTESWSLLPTVTLLLLLSISVGCESFFLPAPGDPIAEIPEAEELFQKLLQSYQTVDFEGKITFISPAPERALTGEAMLIKKAPDKMRIEFVWPSEVRGVGMVIDGKKRWPIRDKRDRRRRPFLPPLPNRMMEEFTVKNIQLLLQNYDIRVLDGGSVAGRSTYLVEVDPKLTGRPSVKIWMDAEMSIILKMESYDSQKRLGGLFAYSQVNFRPAIDQAVFRRSDGTANEVRPQEGLSRREIWNYNQGGLNLDEIRKEVRLDVILPDQAPAGFALQSIHAVRFGERENIHLTYSDGLAVLSVFQSRSDGGMRGGRRGGGVRDRRGRREEMPPWRQGSVEKLDIDGVECEVISRGPMLIFRWNHGGVYFTLMGELGKEEMAGIVSSFVSKGGE